VDPPYNILSFLEIHINNKNSRKDKKKDRGEEHTAVPPREAQTIGTNGEQICGREGEVFLWLEVR